MRNLLASIFRLLFLVKPVRYFYFAFDKRIFGPLKLFKGISKSIIYRKAFRMTVQLDDWIPQQLYFLGAYEEKEIRFISKKLHTGDIFIDVGANIGLFTMVASRIVGDNGKVYAFEPLSANFQKLSFHVSENNLGNVTAEQLAVADRNERLTLFVDDRWNNSGMATAYPSSFNRQESVAGISLDNYFHQVDLRGLSLIKIDIEGGELLALFGMVNLLVKYRPAILIELNPEIMEKTRFTESDVEAFLSKFGYAKKFIDNSGDIIDQRLMTDNSRNVVFI